MCKKNIYEIGISNFVSMKDTLSLGKKNKYSVWHTQNKDNIYTASYRLKQKMVTINLPREVSVKKDDIFFTMGSCFARRLEDILNRKGMNVPGFSFLLNRRDLFSTMRYVNKYNTYTMLYEVEYALGIKNNIYDTIMGSDKEGYFCCQSVYLGKEDYDTVKKRRDGILKSFSFISKADVIVITLGLTEAWYDNVSKRFINYFLPRFMLKEEGRYFHKNITVEENINNLCLIYEYLKKYNKNDFKIFITVSPVPLLKTFTNYDVIVANNLSKSILRVAAEKFANLYENVYYFPSYEIAMFSQREYMFEYDLRHISEQGAEHIINTFLKIYM